MWIIGRLTLVRIGLRLRYTVSMSHSKHYTALAVGLAFCLVLCAGPFLAEEPVDVSTIGEAKRLSNGALVRIGGKIASSGSSDFTSIPPHFATPNSTGAVQEPAINEASGIAASRKNPGALWTHNDSGDSARFFAIDSTGRYLGAYTLSGISAFDWEDMAVGPGPDPGKGYVYIGDIGDNYAIRGSIRVLRVEEPGVSLNQTPVSASLSGAESITLRYEDGARDAESLMIDPINGDLYIVSKRESRSRLYRAAASELTSAGTVTLRFKAELPWGWATGGDISPDGDEIIVRGRHNASLWIRPPGSNLWDAFKQTAHSIPIANEPQGEAICFDWTGVGYFTLSEYANQPLYYAARLAPPAASFFYLEEPTMQAGVRVRPAEGTSPIFDRGALLDLTGSMNTLAGGEREIDSAEVQVKGASHIRLLNCSVKDTYCGLSTGLLMTTVARIASIDSAGAHFTITDGNGVSARVAFDGRAYRVGQLIKVTGACSRAPDGGGVAAVLLPRGVEDVKGY